MALELKNILENIYNKFNHKRYIDPDPLQFLYQYDSSADREIAGLVAAALAYGRVAQINKSVDWVLCRMGPSPRKYLVQADTEEMVDRFSGFVHRFAKTGHLVGLLTGIKGVLASCGSLNRAFLHGYTPNDETVLDALNYLVKRLLENARVNPAHLLPLPERGSASKRLHLFLRWMVRNDDVDPGCWTGICPSKLIIPLDVHMHTVCRELGFTRNNSPVLKTALAVTAEFRKMTPEDPVKYDFSLTRPGIRKDAEIKDSFQGQTTKNLT